VERAISNGGWYKRIASENRIFIAGSLSQPPVEIDRFHWWLYYENRQWKYVSTGGSRFLKATTSELYVINIPSSSQQEL
jgi:hypothetical protein